MKQSKNTFSYFLLWVTAIIWGFAFVAQRKGMEFVGPFTFNGVRFLLGSLFLIPFIFFSKEGKKSGSAKPKISLVLGGAIAASFLFLGASFQQIGIVNTTAGNAGFITSLYVVITPLLGLLFKQKLKLQIWAGVVLATIGLYFLSVTESFEIGKGDLMVLIGSFFFACHVLFISWISPQFNVLKISVLQFLITAFLSLIVAFSIEEVVLDSILKAAIPIIYGGVFSVGIAYTLQVAGQKKTKPSLAAIILSFESLFAAIGGWFILNEILDDRKILGCLLMLAGIIIAQIKFKKNKNDQS